MEFLAQCLRSHLSDPVGVAPLDASVPRASREVAGLGPRRTTSDSMAARVGSIHDERCETNHPLRLILNLFAPQTAAPQSEETPQAAMQPRKMQPAARPCARATHLAKSQIC